MELKSFFAEAYKLSRIRVNRTFMELKLLNFFYEWPRAKWVNRTFMELKSADFYRNRNKPFGLIVPLWN